MKLDDGKGKELDLVKIREYLIKNRLHQYHLALDLKISESVLSKILRGRLKPSKGLVGQIQRILNGQTKVKR